MCTGNDMDANLSKKMGGADGAFSQAVSTLFTQKKLVHESILVLKYLAGVSLGRLGQADEVADLVSFLASPRAKYITGKL
jgi:NAD(P)-dependent dehydrogenase (short-subunit alcohol dehydrogenase family)